MPSKNLCVAGGNNKNEMKMMRKLPDMRNFFNYKLAITGSDKEASPRPINQTDQGMISMFLNVPLVTVTADKSLALDNLAVKLPSALLS